MTKNVFYKLLKKADLTQQETALRFEVTTQTIKNMELHEREGTPPKKYFIYALKYLLTGK